MFKGWILFLNCRYLLPPCQYVYRPAAKQAFPILSHPTPAQSPTSHHLRVYNTQTLYLNRSLNALKSYHTTPTFARSVF